MGWSLISEQIKLHKKFYLLRFLISFNWDFQVNAERMIVEVKQIARKGNIQLQI